MRFLDIGFLSGTELSLIILVHALEMQTLCLPFYRFPSAKAKLRVSGLEFSLLLLCGNFSLRSILQWN